MGHDVNVIQGGEVCYFCKKTGHQKRDCRKYKEWKKNNPDKKTGSSNRKPISCYNCEKGGHITQECRGERRNNGRRENGTIGGGQMGDLRERIKKLVLDAVFL